MTSDATHLLTLLERLDGKIEHRAKLHEPGGHRPDHGGHPASSGRDHGQARRRAGTGPGRFHHTGLCASQRR